MMFLAQVEPNLWNGATGGGAMTKAIIGLLLGFGILAACLFAPARARRPIVSTAIFLSGAYWVAFYFWPKAVNRQAGDIPANAIERFAFWMEDANPIVNNLSTILTAFLLGLGVFSLVRIHSIRVFKGQKDASYSVILLASVAAMAVFGYMDWYQREFTENGAMLADSANWGLVQYGRDLLFDGMFQEMEATMFSTIAFFILSAAYRAFRVRSIEATILLAAAFVVMLSLMGALEYLIGAKIDAVTGGNADSFLNNLKLTAVSGWLRENVQTPSIRALEFGIGLGALAMGLRLWLSLEKVGGNS